MFEEAVCRTDKLKMMDEIIEKGLLLDPEYLLDLLSTENTSR